MEYFLITKTDKINTIDKKLKLTNGFEFNQRFKIRIYNKNIIKYILTKKINKNLKNITNLLLLIEESDDDTSDELYDLQIKITTLRSIVLEKYSKYIGEKITKDYLIKLNKLEVRAGGRIRKRRMR